MKSLILCRLGKKLGNAGLSSMMLKNVVLYKGQVIEPLKAKVAKEKAAKMTTLQNLARDNLQLSSK